MRVRQNLGYKSSPPQPRRGGAKRRGGVGQEIDFLEQHHPSRGFASALPSSTEEGSLWLALLLIAILASVAPLHARPDLPRIAILPNVSVKDSRVLLTDLLTPETRQTLAAHTRIHNVSIAISPLPGKAKSLDGRVVRDRLADFGITADRFSIQIPDQIRLERQGQTLLASEIETLAREQFLPKLPWADVQLQEIAISEPIVLPYGKVELDFERQARTDLARPFYLNIDFRVDGQLVKRAYVRTVLTVSDIVAVAAREISPSETITAADVELERRPLKSTLRRPVRDASYFEGRKLRTAITAGEPLFEEMFVSVPLIRRGDTVTVVFDDGLIRVSAQGESLGSGSKGDRIRVMNATSHVELIAEVVNETTVRVVNGSRERTAK